MAPSATFEPGPIPTASITIGRNTILGVVASAAM
jgi:hypothetical protein